MLHHSPWGVDPFVRNGPGGVPTIVTGRTWERVWAALDGAYFSYAILLYVCYDHFAAPSLAWTGAFEAFINPEANRMRRITNNLATRENVERSGRAVPLPLIAPGANPLF